MNSALSIRKGNFMERKILERILCLCLVIPFCEAEGLNAFLPFSWEFFVLVDAIVLLMAAIFLKRIKIYYIYIGIFYFMILASTVINSGDTFAALYYAARMICLVILIDLYAQRQGLRLLLSTFKLVLGIEILLTLFFQVVAQDIFGFTLSHNYINFLTADNDLGYWYLPFTLIVYLSDAQKSRKYQIIDLLFWIGICLTSLVFAWSATCMSIYVLFALCIIFYKIKIFQFLTPFRSVLINIGISILVIFFHIQDLFGWLIVDILHKNMTLSSRTLIWASAIQNILKKPIFGYGTMQGGRMSINRLSGRIHFFSHNIFLEIVIQGGLVALFFYIIIYFFAGKTLKHFHKSDVTILINLSLFFILLMQFTEFALYEPFANLPLILCFFYKELLREGFAREYMDNTSIFHRKG